MSIPLQGCEYKDFMPVRKKDEKQYCIQEECGKLIRHKGKADYCSTKCFQKDYYTKYSEQHDAFRTDRYELAQEQGGLYDK